MYADWLSYSPITGEFTWIKPPNRRIKVGSIAGTKLKDGHIHIKLQGKYMLAHRLAWYLNKGTWPKDQLDHINRNPADNRLENLRESSQAENTQNRLVDGVTLEKRSGNWIAKIMLQGKVKYLGAYKDRVDACAVYLKEKQMLHTFFYIE